MVLSDELLSREWSGNDGEGNKILHSPGKDLEVKPVKESRKDFVTRGERLGSVVIGVEECESVGRLGWGCFLRLILVRGSCL